MSHQAWYTIQVSNLHCDKFIGSSTGPSQKNAGLGVAILCTCRQIVGCGLVNRVGMVNSWSILALFRVSGPSSVVPLYCQRWDKMKLPWFGSRRAQRRLGDEMIWNVGCEAAGFRNSAGARVAPQNKWPFLMEKNDPKQWNRPWLPWSMNLGLTLSPAQATDDLKMGLGALDLTPLKGRAEKAPPSKWFPETKEVEIGKWSELIELMI